MSSQNDFAHLPVGEFHERIRDQMIPLSNQFSYFFATPPPSEEDLREYLADPIASLPPALCAFFPRVSFVLVPYLERSNGKDREGNRQQDLVCFEKPVESRIVRDALLLENRQAVLVFGIHGQEMADYHYRLFHALARLAGEVCPADRLQDYNSLLREELGAGVNGEVDEASWHLKQALRRRQTNLRRDTKAFREYSKESFVDSLTLYLHGICCDIDVEPGPRQLPSRHLRRRLKLLNALYPPPPGYAVFPEDLDHTVPPDAPF